MDNYNNYNNDTQLIGNDQPGYAPQPEPQSAPQPAYNQPNYAQPNYNQPVPNYNQPVYNQPNYNQPNYNQPNYNQPNYNYNKPETPPAQGFAIASLVCGIISLFCFALICGPLAIIFGGVAKSKGNRSGMATAGIIIGIIGLVLYVIVLIVGAGLSMAGY